MKGIYYKEGIYVLIESDNHENSVFDYNKFKVPLFGNRVEIISNGAETAFLNVDGISIKEINSNGTKRNLSFSKITSYLNAIEANGVDAFIDNYKKSVEFVYSELKDLNRETELLLSTQNEKININKILSQIKNIRDLLISVLAILFSLNTYMSAGIENEKIISVYQSILDALA